MTLTTSVALRVKEQRAWQLRGSVLSRDRQLKLTPIPPDWAAESAICPRNIQTRAGEQAAILSACRGPRAEEIGIDFFTEIAEKLQ